MGASLRRETSEAHYQYEKELGRTKDLRSEPTVWEGEHWVMIPNRYPYDGVFQQHDLLLPKRDFAHARDMTTEEYGELRNILDSDIGANYHIFFENSMHRRSHKGLFHLHLGAFYETREEFGL